MKKTIVGMLTILLVLGFSATVYASPCESTQGSTGLQKLADNIYVDEDGNYFLDAEGTISLVKILMASDNGDLYEVDILEYAEFLNLNQSSDDTSHSYSGNVESFSDEFYTPNASIVPNPHYVEYSNIGWTFPRQVASNYYINETTRAANVTLRSAATKSRSFNVSLSGPEIKAVTVGVSYTWVNSATWEEILEFTVRPGYMAWTEFQAIGRRSCGKVRFYYLDWLGRIKVSEKDVTVYYPRENAADQLFGTYYFCEALSPGSPPPGPAPF